MRGRPSSHCPQQCRWNHPEYGLVVPDDFVPLAEVTGLHAESLMKAILSGATFGDTTVPQLVAAAGRGQN